MIKIKVDNLSHFAETLLTPLYLRAKETLQHGIIEDHKSVELVDQIDYDFSVIDKDWKTQIGIAVRTSLFDEIIAQTTKQNSFVIVNLGAGLDTRQERFSKFKWYHIDLPESIELRNYFFNYPATINIGRNLMDFSWIDEITERRNVFFIAEGLFMYFDAEEVQRLLTRIGESFTQSYIAFNTLPKSLLGGKMLSIDNKKVPFKWGNDSVAEIEDWKMKFAVEKIYNYFDHQTKRLGGFKYPSTISAEGSGLKVVLLKTTA